MLNIIELLSLRGLDTSKKIKLVRHQDKRINVNELYDKGQFELYQSIQAKPVFECDYIISFLGMEQSKARFVGVYKVNGRKFVSDITLPEDFEFRKYVSRQDNFYFLEDDNKYNDLKQRVIINWGKSALAWHQKLSEKEVIEILPAGYVMEFPGFFNIILKYDKLVSIINNPDAYRQWHEKLSSVSGIYLITDQVTGFQYIGSAYGQRGILGRWTDYVKNPDGGNCKLKELLSTNRNYAKNLQFSILEIFPNTLLDKEVINREKLYMEKLKSQKFGLNY